MQRAAYIDLRQSTAAQVLRNRESTDRRYGLADRALQLGWPKHQIIVIDEHLARSGFATITTEVALGHAGLILSIEVSRVARNNTDWDRLLDLCGVTGSSIGGRGRPLSAWLFNDRLLSTMNGTMAEAEFRVIRTRLESGIRSGVIRTLSDKFAETGSARQVWLWFRSQPIPFPLQSSTPPEIQWVDAIYDAIYHVLTNSVYAGAYMGSKASACAICHNPSGACS